ncbi:MAG: hypothetical protein KIT33_05575 [Candidatus Kapabacteria bacterium]|nr:hypothetical protein [Ignavibacteriota bacterium]MCW5884426.1 hypothetical protein [Candidatus Kapabacteria bacterium]
MSEVEDCTIAHSGLVVCLEKLSITQGFAGQEYTISRIHLYVETRKMQIA